MNEFVAVWIFLEPLDQKRFLPSTEIVKVSRIKCDIDNISKFVIENRTSLSNRWNFLHNIIVLISLIVLGEEIEELGSL